MFYFHVMQCDGLLMVLAESFEGWDGILLGIDLFFIVGLPAFLIDVVGFQHTRCSFFIIFDESIFVFVYIS
jgi:hypothetical protein